LQLVHDLPFIQQGTELLRIQRKANGDVVFTVSGRIDKENIAELEALIGAEGKDRRIVLDLKDMTLTGQDGINFLAQCEAAGVALVNCDPYVREWITGQISGS
jgi:anti-anti-sigma regulatory factor